MFVSRITLKNWRNFRKVDVDLHAPTYLIGPNASGKSNLLDVFRFLRDVCKPAGGGLAKAVEARGGITKLRCLHARKDTEVRIEVHLKETLEDDAPAWRYILGFKSEGQGKQRPTVSVEQVWHRDKTAPIIDRPDARDKRDRVRLTQTYLEQINTNEKFREVVEFFASATYLHLVPQLLKFADQIGGSMV